MKITSEIADYLRSSEYSASEVFAALKRKEVAVEAVEAQVNVLKEEFGERANKAASVFIAEA